MPVHASGAQRASLSRSLRLTAFALMTALTVGLGAMANPEPVSAAAVKVVIVVGPVGSSTRDYKASAKRYAALARTYGATVVEVYSPYATWTKVKAATNGANILVYLGHGNGWPSPYGPFQKLTKDGLGLNSRSGHGNSNLKYRGEYYVARDMNLARNAVVILNRLCYASGNSEWGRANPTKTTAKKRVDNYGAGFLRANARAVFAEATSSISYTLKALLTSNQTVDSIFMGHPSASGARDFRFSSSRTPGYRAHMDPPKAGKYWRSLIGNLSLTATQVRGG
ncbi:MAG TPA: hypothetical protein VIH00_12560 [Candidatus Limnocylindrales bacterium]